MSERPLLEVRNLRVVYPGDDGDFRAVRNVSFTLGRERLGIVGESGSGKSTTGRAIMGLIARYSESAPGKQKMSRAELIGLIQSDAKFMDEREDIAAYINTLKAGEGLSEKAIRDGYSRFKAEKNAAELAGIAGEHGLAIEALQGFVDTILQRMIFDGEALTDLMEPLGLNWKTRRVKELDLMADLLPLLLKRAAGREISGLSAYEQ